MSFSLATLAVFLPQPRLAASDYLLAEGPATGSLELEGTSYGKFREKDDFTGSLEGLLEEGGPFGRFLTRRFPAFGDLFSGAEVSLRPRSYYRYVRRPGGIEQEAFPAGGALGVTSGWWNEMLQFGWTGYTTQKIHGPSGRGGTGLLDFDQNSVSVLGELWAKARWREFFSQVGRGVIDLPYLSSMIADFDRPGELAGRLSVETDFSALVPGLSGVVSAAAGDTDHGPDQRNQEELDVTVDYRTPCLDDLWLRVRGAWRDRDGDLTEDYRVILNYEKRF